MWEKKNYGGSQNSLTDLSEILWKFFAEVKTEKGQALTPSALTGMRAAIHHHLTCAPLSQNINISQDSKFMSANKMLTGLNWMPIYSDMNDILYVYMHQIFRFFYRKTITTTWKLMEVRVACLGWNNLHSINLNMFIKPLLDPSLIAWLGKNLLKNLSWIGLLAHYGLNSQIFLIVVKARSSLFKHFLKD